MDEQMRKDYEAWREKSIWWTVCRPDQHDDSTSDAASTGRLMNIAAWESWQAAAALSQPAAAEWQPIETAPKTGRTLLLGYFNSHGNWRTMRGQWMTEEYIAENWEEPENGEPGWFEESVEADDVPNCWATNPTHWQPLPAAPKATP